MRILAIHNYYRIRSGEDLAFDAGVEALQNEGHQLRKLTRNNQESSFFQMARRVYFSVSAFFEVLRTIREFDPQVAFVQNVFPLLSPSVYLALKLKGIPVVQRVFNYRLVCPNGVLYTQGSICERCVKGNYWNAVVHKCYRNSRLQSFAIASSLWLWRLSGLWLWGVRTFITPDLFLRNKILSTVKDSKKIVTVFNPAPGVTRIVSEKRDRSILFVGRLVKEKGIFTFLKIAEKMSTYNFLVVGKEPGFPDRKTDIPSNVKLLGAKYADDLSSLLTKVGVIVLPSEWYDNMPLILTQAMFHRTPIVASDINGIPEFVIDGVTGRLFEVGNVDAAVVKIKATLTDAENTERMVNTAFLKAQEWFAQENYAKQLLKVLGEHI